MSFDIFIYYVLEKVSVNLNLGHSKKRIEDSKFGTNGVL